LATRHGNAVHLRLADELVPHLLELITTARSADGVLAPTATAGGATT
jgi:hypothetical protein